MAWCRQANADPDLRHHVESLSHNELTIYLDSLFYPGLLAWKFPIVREMYQHAGVCWRRNNNINKIFLKKECPKNIEYLQ